MMEGPLLARRNTALLLIDLQRDVVAAGPPEARDVFQLVVETADRAAQSARALGLTIFLVRVLRRADGADRGSALTDAVLSGRARAPWEAAPLIEGHPGSDWAPPLVTWPTDVIVTKRRVGAFWGTPLDIYFRARSITTLLIGGLFTHMGVETTVREARDRDYQVMVLADCCGAYPSRLHAHCIENTFPLLARVATAAQVFAHVSSN